KHPTFAARSLRSSRIRIADRLRKRRQSLACARRNEKERGRRAYSSRCEPIADRSPTAHRKHRALGCPRPPVAGTRPLGNEISRIERAQQHTAYSECRNRL